MKKVFAKSLVFIIEAGLEVLAERIKKRRKKNGSNRRLDHFPYDRGAYDLRDRSPARDSAMGDRRNKRRPTRRRRSISWES